MRSQLGLLLAALSLLSPGATTAFQRNTTGQSYTVQVASFADAAQAEQLVSRLTSLGERTTAATVELRGRGSWTRVFVGSFGSSAEARIHADRLLRAGLIREFLIRCGQEPLKEPVSAIRHAPRSHLSSQPAIPSSRTRLSMPNRAAASSVAPLCHGEGRLPAGAPVRYNPALRGEPRSASARDLPVAPRVSLAFATSADTRSLPRNDPVRLAFLLVGGQARFSGATQPGGLWLTGNAAEGLARLRWIAGAETAEMVILERDGRVKLDTRLLAKAARVDEFPLSETPLAVTDFIFSNEGLLLLVQLTQSGHRYRLHIARQAPTRGGAVEVTGGINLDDNFDSRINPHRRMGQKMDNERPPDGFDSLVAINPVARWFNQQTNQVVPAAHIAFHELAEAHAKLELGLDYLGDAGGPGAHEVALQREQRLKVQRPLSGVVVTAGSNRVLRSEQEAREFFSRPSGQRQ
ncbi:MAG: SPOR domain-containing protein [Acidobacteriota bacterium]